MAYTEPRTLNDRRGVSLYLLRWFRSTALVVLVLLSTGAIADDQTLTFRNPRDLLVDPPAAFIELLEAARPAPVSIEDMGAILRALPPEGEVTKLGASAQQKVDAVRQLLTATRRDWYEIKVIDLPQAAVALYARTVVLISEPALELLNAAELQAMAAHEVGHEYVWTEWDRARQHGAQQRLKELELVCDAIAAVTLHQLGLDPSRLNDALEKVTRFNRQRFGSADNEKNYPTLAERRAFTRDIQRWLRDSSRRALNLHRGLAQDRGLN
jgi:Zn-dependent protease with chaperone function